MPACPSVASPNHPWRWRALTGLLIIGATGLRFAWLINSPLDLAPDEAHYWDWSRHLDWSYYSKGPLVAWLIRGAMELAGPWSEQLTGHATLAVRLPAVLCGVVFLISLYVLTLQVFANDRLAALTVIVALTLPPVAAMASIMTIDAPYITCWGWALVLAHRAVFPLPIADCRLRIDRQSAIHNPQSAIAWPALGLVVGIGILAKYTMVVFIPSLALFLLTSRNHRALLRGPGFWIMVAVAGLCALPILIWNVQHDWVTFKHVGGLAGMSPENAGLHWLGPLAYLGAQCGLLLGFWFVAWVAAMVAHRPGRAADARLSYLWWMSAPMFFLFLAFSPKTGGGEINWPVTAYVSGLVLTTAWLRELLHNIRGWRRLLVATGCAGAGAIGISLSVLLHHSHAAYPVLGPLTEVLFPNKPLALRQVDPTCRLRGWQMLAAEVDVLRAQLRAEGVEPVLGGVAWWLPGELSFYCAGRPTVYSFGLAAGGRHSQYDLWRPNPVGDAEQFRGKTFILVGDFPGDVHRAFDVLRPPIAVVHRVDGRPVSAWTVRIAEGFRGFPERIGRAAH